MGNQSCCSNEQGKDSNITIKKSRTANRSIKLYAPESQEAIIHGPAAEVATLTKKMNSPSKKTIMCVNTLPEFDFHLKNYQNRGIELGPYKYHDGSTYLGEYLNGLKHGFGEMVWVDGSIYQGVFYKDKCVHYGRLVQSDGDVYQGEWANDRAEGQGEFFS